MPAENGEITAALEFVLELRVDIGPPLELGAGASGERRTVPITGGTVQGAFAGRIIPGGADWQITESDAVTYVDARYVIETADGVRIEVRNQGIRHGPQDVIRRLAMGEPVAPTEYYFRTTPRFYPPHGHYDWLKRSLFIAMAERYSDLVIVRVFKVL